MIGQQIGVRFQVISKKKLTNLILAGLLSFTLATGTGEAADIIDTNLEDSIQRAYANNRTIKQAAANRESAFWSLSVARRQSNPTVNWSMGGSRVGGKSYENSGYDNSWSNTATLSMPLYTGKRLEEQRESARLALNLADLQLENTLQNIRMQATSYYYDVLHTRNMIEVEQSSVRTLEEHSSPSTTVFLLTVLDAQSPRELRRVAIEINAWLESVLYQQLSIARQRPIELECGAP